MQVSPEHLDQAKSSSKPPVVRGARACTVCRAAKMKCVGADDGQKQCQRCKRANVECVFEKHRRGRKPGSKLSEASKMLRRLEKGLSNAKLKSHPGDSSSYPTADTHAPASESSHFSSMRPGEYGPSDGYAASSSGSRSIDIDVDEDAERGDESMFPAKLIRKENQRNSFFRTILNPEHESPSTLLSQTSRNGLANSQSLTPAPLPSGLQDPISAGLIDEAKAKILFDAIFLRLNPFINLFDPALHSVAYVRSKCPFLFTTLIMAGCKFFEPSLYKECLKLAHDMSVRAFADAWKRVEVVQAFACLTYWREHDDNRTWTYIGYACRMAVELGLNRFHAKPPTHETEFQRRERRNRERTYLVLFVHDRSLSMQTGRHWMLPEDDFIRHSAAWHEEGGAPIRCEDVIVSAFVQLRRIATETTDMVYTNRNLSDGSSTDVNVDIVLKNCNGKLAQWMITWENEMQRAGGESFHFSFLNFFRHYVRLFLNSFGVQVSLAPNNRTASQLRALSACFNCALDVLRIASKEFKALGVLRYGQDSTTVMTAYSAIFLLKLLRSSNTHTELHTELQEGAAQEIHNSITSTADAYHEASMLSPTSTSAAYHARFLRSLVFNDTIGARQEERGSMRRFIDPRLHENQTSSSQSSSPPEIYHQPQVQTYDNPYPYAAPSDVPIHQSAPPDANRDYMETPPRTGPDHYQPLAYTAPYGVVTHATEHDANYWRNMFMELGFGANGDQPVSFHDGFRVPPHPHGHGNPGPPSYHLNQAVYGQ